MLSLSIIGAAACLAYVVWLARSPFATYRRFLNGDRKFYAQIAAACDSLRAHADPTGQRRTLQREDVLVPPVLRNLEPQFVDVEPNRVYVRIGVGRASYGIVWEPDDYDPSHWELKVQAEGPPRTVYSVKQN